MKKIVLLSVLCGVAVLGLASVGFSQKKAPIYSNSSQWEYCRVVQQDVANGKGGVGVYFSGSRGFTPYSKNKFEQQTVVQVINQLGAQGWEILSEKEYGYTLKRKK